MDPVTLYHPDGRTYPVDTEAEKVQLLSAGYSETKPEPGENDDQAQGSPETVIDAPQAPAVDVQHPENYTVQEIDAFLKDNPTLRPALVQAEAARGDDARKSIVGDS